jgi:acetyl esterase/lipase
MRDIDYGGQGRKSQTLDLFVPGEAKDPLPVVVWIHGGAWLAGSKEGCPAIRFLTRGYAVASLNYRLTQEAIFPAQIEDCKGAIRWLRANAGKHGLDPNRIGAWGSSAGGHLVALLGTSGDVKELEGKVGGNLEFTSRVQAVCDWFGPTDFLKMIGQSGSTRHAAADSPESLLVGGAIEKMKEMVARANPITYVGKGNPPFLIMHGDKDNLVPINQSEILYDALKKAGVEATFEVVKGAGHGFGGPEVNRKVEEFLDKHLKQAGATTKPAP